MLLSLLQNSFSPPMEFRSSLVNLMENHVCVKRFEFEERDPNGHVSIDVTSVIYTH